MIGKIAYKLFPKSYYALARARAELIGEYKKIPAVIRGGVNGCKPICYTFHYLKYGATPSEYIVLGFSKLNSRGKNEFVTMRRNRWLNKRFNDNESNKILWDKGLFSND